jgi:hypothetical protein
LRSDLPVGVAAAQIIHAAGESSPGNLGAGTFAVALAVPDEAALMKVADRLRAAGMAFTCIFESDAPWSGQLMAIGVRPAARSVMQKVLSSFPLYRGPATEVSALGGSSSTAEHRRS